MLNPIFVKCARSRLRVRHMLTWGLIVVVSTCFIAMIAYLGATERGGATPKDGAKAAILPILVVQAIVLMFFGTGSIASSIAQERENGLLDYQRMTPMRPSAKILGYLFGIPAREYFLLALTMPLIIAAAIVAKFNPLTLLHFYGVFFTSVWLYHLSAMAVGMISSKPRRAGIFAQGFVLLLYFVLPQLSLLGITFFEFLTIRPTFFGLVAAELREVSPAVEQVAVEQFSQLDGFRSVPVFNLMLHPTIYALAVQFFLLSFLFHAIHRKWRDDRAHPLSKLSATIFHLGALTFFTGSLWPIVTERIAYRGVAERLFSGEDGVDPAQMFTSILLVFLCLVGAVSLFVIHIISPSAHAAAAGARRARKLGQPRIPLNADAASAFLTSAVMAITTSGAVGLLIWLASDTGFFDHAPNFALALAPMTLAAALMLLFHAVRERFGGRGALVVFFLIWAIPAFSTLVIAAAEGEPGLARWVALPFPPACLGYSFIYMFSGTVDGEDMREFINEAFDGERELAFLVWTAVAGYTMLAIGSQIYLRIWRRRLLTRAIEQMPDQPAPAHDAVAA